MSDRDDKCTYFLTTVTDQRLKVNMSVAQGRQTLDAWATVWDYISVTQSQPEGIRRHFVTSHV